MIKGQKINTAQNKWAESKSNQNNTPDNNKHAPSAPTPADGTASLSIHDLLPDPSTTCANTTKFPAQPPAPLPTYSDFDEYDNFSLLSRYLLTNSAPPPPMENSPDTSNSTHEPVTPNTSTQPPNPTYTHVDMTDAYPTFTGTATEHDSPPEPPTTPLKTTEQPVIDICTDLAILITPQLAPEQDLAHVSDDIVVPSTLTPGPPGAPPPCTSRTPAPPPAETQDEDGPPDAKGITYCTGGHYKVTVKCIYCGTTHKTGPSNHHNPYTELRGMGWAQGKNNSGNYTWQFARCPDWIAGRNCIEINVTTSLLQQH